jgi:hypothetical protein
MSYSIRITPPPPPPPLLLHRPGFEHSVNS